MANVASVPRVAIYLAAATCTILAGIALTGDSNEPAPQPVAQRTIAAAPIAAPIRPVIDVEPADTDEEPSDDDTMRGHAAIDDPAEFGFVFAVDGVTYLRLSTEDRATRTGKPRLITGDEIAVVAAVEPSAMPASLRGWAGRKILVDGECEARVVGFAEISRVSGEPPGTDEYHEYDEDIDSVPHEAPQWTIEAVVEDNVVLAGRLDDCTGSWARAESFPAAAVAVHVDEPKLEAAARAELLARSADDPIQVSWKADGGEGDWRDAAEVVTHTYKHSLTNERWVIVQARHPGGCGEPGFELMAVYRASAGGAVRRVADLPYGLTDVEDVVDLDGDGQPELVMGEGTSLDLVDLTGEGHASISVPVHSYGCGC
ncbi:MAG: hypothetical protein ABI867_03010 [Kofleriaceae bacterium]